MDILGKKRKVSELEEASEKYRKSKEHYLKIREKRIKLLEKQKAPFAEGTLKRTFVRNHSSLYLL